MQRLGAHDASSALSSLDRLDAQQRDYKRIFARFEQQMKGFSNVSEELAMMSEGLGGGGGAAAPGMRRTSARGSVGEAGSPWTRWRRSWRRRGGGGAIGGGRAAERCGKLAGGSDA